MSGKDNENGVKVGGFQFRKPLNRTKWESFRKAIYDSSTHEFLGRTGKSWGQLLVFYTIFYIVLAALFAICMQGLLATLDDKEPKWKLDRSLIGTNPGMGFRPISPRTEEGSLIWYNRKNKTTSDKWIKILNETLKQYGDNQIGKNFDVCDFDKPPEEGRVCAVDLKRYGPCSPEKNYGYYSNSPCVFLKLNKIYGWEPDYYTAPHEDMTEDLKAVINNTPVIKKKQVWISCQGQGPTDRENVNATFSYFPDRGFASYYFPYKNVDNYLSPFIAVQINNVKPNVIVSIECRAWAKNIVYRGGDLQREGSVHFEILVDEPLSTDTKTE